MSTVTPKTVMFDVMVGDIADWWKNKEQFNNSSAALEGLVLELSRGLWGINAEQEYIIARMAMHHRVSEHTNHVLIQWCVFEVMLIIFGMSFEIWYIRRLFEVRRMV